MPWLFAQRVFRLVRNNKQTHNVAKMRARRTAATQYSHNMAAPIPFFTNKYTNLASTVCHKKALCACDRDHKKRRGTKEDPDWGELNPRKFSPFLYIILIAPVSYSSHLRLLLALLVEEMAHHPLFYSFDSYRFNIQIFSCIFYVKIFLI